MATTLTAPPAPTVDLADVTSTLERNVPALVSLIRSATSPDARATGDWSARDVAIHLAFVLDHYQEILHGRGAGADSFDDAARQAQAFIDGSDLGGMKEIADAIESNAEHFIDGARRIDGDPIVPYVGGIPVATSCVVAIVLGEVLVHGYDVSGSQGRSWHIDPHAAALTLKGISAVTVQFVDREAARGFSARYDVGFRKEAHVHYVFDDGTLRIEEPTTEKVDVHISADPPTLLLMGYGRINPIKPALTGKLLAWGRKPWLSMKMATLLKNP
ncbi:MAG: maleylpyruvate isomerase N-terminal domain-containing protein [Actinomycetota bacterium]|nr:maleylpyruvate isomerase N-terminal domain-containing protein [Actinomycetota bacterium]